MSAQTAAGRTVTLADIVEPGGVFVDGDWVESKDQDPEGNVRLVQLADVGDGEYRDRSSRFLTVERAKDLRCTFLERGDLLVARMPDPLGRACIFPGDLKRAVTVVDVAVVRPRNPQVNDRWLMYQLNAPTFRREVAALQSGSTRQRISRKNLASISFHLPGRRAQDEAVAEIEKQFSRLDEAVANLQRVKVRIRHYKQAVLESATAAWPMVATGQLCDCIVPNRDKPGSFSGDILWLTLPDFDGNEIEIGRSKVGLGLTAAEVLTSKAKVVPARSVVMSCVGRFGITAVLQRPAVINQQLHAFLPSDRVLPKYLAYALRTRVREMESKATATTIAYLNKTNCNSISVPVPPLAEQHRIVAEVDRRLSIVREVEAEVDANLKRAQALRQAVLGRAFQSA